MSTETSTIVLDRRSGYRRTAFDSTFLRFAAICAEDRWRVPVVRLKGLAPPRAHDVADVERQRYVEAF
jgi:hypothetical protein